MKYRIFAVLLALLMIAGMLPSAAFAEGEEPELIPEEELLPADPEPEAEPLPDEEYIIPEVIEEEQETEEEPSPLPKEEEETEEPEDPQPEPPSGQGDEPSPAPDPEPESEEEPSPVPEEPEDPPAVFEETDGEEGDLPPEGLPVLDYVDNNGNARQLAEYVRLTGESACLEDGLFYVADGVLTLPAGLTVNGTASLLLTDDALLTVSSVTLTEGNTLLIYGQEAQKGVLSVTGDRPDAAAIGCGAGENCGTLVICGGCIDACGPDGFPAIGGGEDSLCGAVTVFGGTLSAVGGAGSAAISAGLLPDEDLSLTLGEGLILYVSPDDSTPLAPSAPEAFCAPDAQPMQVVAVFSSEDEAAAQAFGITLPAEEEDPVPPAAAAGSAAEENASISVSMTSNIAEEVTSGDASVTADVSDGSDDPDDPEEQDAPAGELSAGSADEADAEEAAAAMPAAFTAMLFNATLGDPAPAKTPVEAPEVPSWVAPEEDGTDKTFSLVVADDALYEVVGGKTKLTQKNAGKYIIKLQLKDETATEWEVGTYIDDAEDPEGKLPKRNTADNTLEYTFIIKAIPKENTEEEKGNFGGIALNFSRAEIEAKLLTDADKAALAEGTPVFFWLEAKQTTLSGDAKTKCDAAVSSINKVMHAPLWLDIRLKKWVASSPTAPFEDVQPVSGSVHIRADVSSANLIDSTRNRSFFRVHYHDGDSSASRNSQALTDGRFFEFDTANFSVFGFPYYDSSTVKAIVSSPTRASIEGEAQITMREGDEHTFTAKVNVSGYYFGRVKVDGELVTEFPGVGTGRASYTFTNKTPLKEHTIEFVMYDSNGAPATGDASAPGLWAAAAACAALGLCCLLRRKRSA